MSIELKFARIGARVRVRNVSPPQIWHRGTHRWWSDQVPPVAIDVMSDRGGEYFDIAIRKEFEAEALDVDPGTRHLLLMVRLGRRKPRYLCGHDERHWFVAAIPERTPVSTVEDAQVALQPKVVADGAPFVRQGEWFFVPAPEFEPTALQPIRRREPLSRGAGSTPHVAAEAVRRAGTVVYLLDPAWRDESPRGLHSETEMRRLARLNPKWTWTQMLRDPELYVRGPIRHPDHATITLREWHRVYMNTESEARAAAHVVFLD